MSDHIKEIASVLVSRGFTPVAAAGIIGNAYQESGWNPASVGDGGGGLWGFTSGDISLGALQSYAQAHGASWTNAKVQANFLADHVDTQTRQTLNSIKSPTAAASYFMNNWERPYVPTENEARRQQGAEIAYKQISGAPLKAVAKSKSMGTKKQTTAPTQTVTTTTAPTSSAASVLAGLMTPASTTAVPTTVSVSIPKLTPVAIK